MRICFVTHYTRLYGANRSLLCLIDGLQAYGVQSHVIAPKQGPITEELSKRGIPFYTLPFKQWMAEHRWKAPARLGMNFGLLPLLARKAYQWDVDLIHTNSSVTPIGALLAEVLRIPHVWHVREFGDLDFGFQHDWGGVPFRKLFYRADAAIAVSEAVHQHVLAEINTPSYIVYNGVISQDQLEQLRSGEKKTRGDGFSSPYTFAIVGRISPEKGQEQALQSLHHLEEQGKDVRLLIAGNGDKKYLDSLHQLSKSLNLEKVLSFLGYVSDPFEVYRKSDAVLMCSPNEAMGRVTAEAMAAARPVIGYDSGGTSELIKDGKTGLLYNGTVTDLTRKMAKVIDNVNWSRNLSCNAQKYACNTFAKEVYTNKIYKIYKKIT